MDDMLTKEERGLIDHGTTPANVRATVDRLCLELREKTSQNARLAGEVARLGKTIQALPKTADGVPIVPGMMVYPPCGHGNPLTPDCFTPIKIDAVSCWESSCHQEDFGENDYHDSYPTKYAPDKCYSTRAAAESARDHIVDANGKGEGT